MYLNTNLCYRKPQSTVLNKKKDAYAFNTKICKPCRPRKSIIMEIYFCEVVTVDFGKCVKNPGRYHFKHVIISEQACILSRIQVLSPINEVKPYPTLQRVQRV